MPLGSSSAAPVMRPGPRRLPRPGTTFSEACVSGRAVARACAGKGVCLRARVAAALAAFAARVARVAAALALPAFLIRSLSPSRQPGTADSRRRMQRPGGASGAPTGRRRLTARGRAPSGGALRRE